MLLDGLHSPFFSALVNGMLYVVNADALVRFPYHEGDLRITAAATKVMDLPGRPARVVERASGDGDACVVTGSARRIRHTA